MNFIVDERERIIDTSTRIPDIFEFKPGFKYEVYSEGYDDSIEDITGWYSYNFQQGNCWRDLEDIENELKQNNIRTYENSI